MFRLLLALCLLFSSASAQTPELPTLQALVESMTSMREQLASLQTKAKTGDTAAKVEADAVQLRLSQAQRDLETVATGVDSGDFTTQATTAKLDLAGEFNELIQPFMAELKSATEQPRIIEGLRGQVAGHQRKLLLADRALENLDRQLKALAKAKDPSPEVALKRQISSLQDRWKGTRQQTDAALKAVQHQLDDTLAKRKTLWQILTDAARLFFLTRGRNLLLAALAVCGTYLGWRWLYQRLIRFSPWHKKQSDKPFLARATDVAHYLAGFVISVLAALAVLYSTGDWLLLGLCLISLIGLGLAAKTGLPKYYRQARLMLNLGEVREGERVVLNGLSWQVKSLGAFSVLTNPSVRNGHLRVPLTQIMTLSSRPHTQGEPWFPCKETDWVQLADGTFGRVVCISPEFVQLVQLGGAHKTYPTARFLNENPVNYTGGFRVSSVLRLDHKQQSLATTDIPEKLRTSLMKGLLTHVQPEELKSLKVEYRTTTPVALEIEILADFSGQVAEHFQSLQRAIQRYALECSTAEQWPLASQVVQLQG